MKYLKKLAGEKCYLSPINIDDAKQYTKWLNDLELTRFLTMANQNISIEKEKELLKKLSKKHNYAIIDQKTDKLIGNCGLVNINNIHRKAEIGIFIGDNNFLSKGYGTEALSLLIEYAINYLNIQNIFLRVHDFNKRAIKSYKKIGFKKIGKRRKANFIDGKYCDEILMDLLDEDFLKFH